MPIDVPRWLILERLVASYEAQGAYHQAAASLVTYGDRPAVLEGARRLEALGAWAAAGAAYAQADAFRQALPCYEQAGDTAGVLRCWQALGDAEQVGVTLVALGRAAEACPHLAAALAALPATDRAGLARVGLHLARAWHQAGDAPAAAAAYRQALAHLDALTATDAPPADIAAAWEALGQWGAATGRADRMQEGYAEARRVLAAAGPPPAGGRREAWQRVTAAYQQAAAALGNQVLVRQLTAELTTTVDDPPPPPDPAQALLDAGQWDAALADLRPRVATGQAATLRLLVEGLVENAAVPRALRLEAATLPGSHDPRGLDATTGDNALGSYWCAIAPGPFWSGIFLYGEDEPALTEQHLAEGYRIGRYPVTNAEYARFITAGGYHEPEWWTAHGWAYKEEKGWIQPRLWEDERYNAPGQPVVGVSWWEAAAYARWLTAVGREARWLPADAVIRLPTAREWERAARHTDQRRYPWGDAEPTPEHANYDETGIGRPTPVGCFPAGAAVCGALDLAGNVMEWTATPYQQRLQVRAEEDFTPGSMVLLSWSYFGCGKSELTCGSRSWDSPYGRYSDQGFRLVRSLRSSG